MKTKQIFLHILLIALLFGGVSTTSAQTKQENKHAYKQLYALELSSRSNSTNKPDSTSLSGVVEIENAPWLRLHIGDFDLGKQSYIIITSLLDGGQQRLDAKSLARWRKNSAFFNGDVVKVELHHAPTEKEVFVRLSELTVGKRIVEAGKNMSAPQTLCGNDDRVASTDARVGRTNTINTAGATSNPFCTAWLVSNGALLTAGHCVDNDPDQGGPLLPDGVADAGFVNGVVEFNVPASLSNGTTVFASPNDQYPMDAFAWRHDGNGQGLGKDWAVFTSQANSNTNLLPHLRQGAFFRMSSETPAINQILRVTGFGTDVTPVGTGGGGNAQNQTLQTATGTFSGEASSGADVWHNYKVDTTGGNSGGPIIWETSGGFTIGIHTNGGCTATGGDNVGTSFEHDALETALRVFSGTNAVHVDPLIYPGITNAARDGTIFRPLNNVISGVNAVPTGGTVNIVPGTYSSPITINRAMTLRSPAGTTTIGQN